MEFSHVCDGQSRCAHSITTILFLLDGYHCAAVLWLARDTGAQANCEAPVRFFDEGLWETQGAAPAEPKHPYFRAGWGETLVLFNVSIDTWWKYSIILCYQVARAVLNSLLTQARRRTGAGGARGARQ